SDVTAIGSGAFGASNNILGSRSYAVGFNNTIAQENTFVLGNNVITGQANSVILGNESEDAKATEVTGPIDPNNGNANGFINGHNYSYAGAEADSADGVISVGAEGAERQIINVASGKVNEDSTDAVNGSQLFAVQDAVEKPITFVGDAG